MNTKFYTLSSYKNTLISFLCHMSCKIETTGIHCQKVHFHVMGHARSLGFFFTFGGEGTARNQTPELQSIFPKWRADWFVFFFSLYQNLNKKPAGHMAHLKKITRNKHAQAKLFSYVQQLFHSQININDLWLWKINI